MAIIIAVANQKGGVGKTTTVISLAAGLVATGRKTLVVDVDPQTSLTAATLGERIASGIESSCLTIFDALCLGEELKGGDLQPAGDGFSVLAGSYNLVGADEMLSRDPGREYRLQKILGPLAASFDYVLLDCPPGLGLLMINALVAATHVLIPVAPRFVDSRGLAFLMDTVARVRETFNDELAILGILPTMVRRRSRHGYEMKDVLEEHFSDLLIEPGIPDTVSFWSAPATLSSILISDPNSPGASAYREVAREVIRRAEL